MKNIESKPLLKPFQVLLLLWLPVDMETRWHGDDERWEPGNENQKRAGHEVCINTMTNGCSSPGPLRLNRYNRIFLDACNRHDVCYECVSIPYGPL